MSSTAISSLICVSVVVPERGTIPSACANLYKVWAGDAPRVFAKARRSGWARSDGDPVKVQKDLWIATLAVLRTSGNDSTQLI